MEATWSFPRPDPDADDLVAFGADLAPQTLIAAYAAGYFPMPMSGPLERVRLRRANGGPRIGWFSLQQRGVLRPEALDISHSLAKSTRRYHLSVDADFEAVIAGCADPARRGRWISDEILEAYVRLHRSGLAHSVEVRNGDDELVGGVYGLSLGALFAGESMFHTARDGSKVALVGLTALLMADSEPGTTLIDTQWVTPHLASLGIEEWDRERYLDGLPDLIGATGPDFARWAGDPAGFTELARSRAKRGRHR